MSSQQQQNVSSTQPTVSTKPGGNPDQTPTRSQVNLSKYNFNYGGGPQGGGEDQADLSKAGITSSKAMDYQYSGQLQANQKQYNPSWFNDPSYHQYGKQGSLHSYEAPSTTRNQQMQQVPMGQNLYNVPQSNLMNSMYQSQLGPQMPPQTNQVPNELLLQLAMAQTQNSNYPPQQQQQLLQQQLQLINSLLSNQNAPPRPQMLSDPSQSQFQNRSNLILNNNGPNPMIASLLNQGLMTPSQQKSFMTPWNDQSTLPTPLDSSRYVMEQPNNPMHQMSTQSQASPSFQQYVPQQHHQFVNNYQQHIDNLNQYKKLVTLLESIDQKKANPGMLQPSPPIYTPMEKPPQPYQQNFMGYMSSMPSQSPPFQSQSTKKEEVQEKQKFDYANETLGSIAWPSVNKPGGEEDRSCYNTFSQSKKDLSEGQFFNETRLEEENQQRNEMNQPEKSYQLYLEEASKISGGEVTKGSITDMLNPGPAQIEENKSLEEQEFQNQSQMSGDARLGQSAGKSNDFSQNEGGEGENGFSQRSGVEKDNSQNYMSTNEGDGLVGMSNENMKDIIDDKPIVNKQMTFEELLESKLQEESVPQNQAPKVPPKREFLRKSSNIRGQATGQGTQERPKSKYRYYADNFSQNPPPAGPSKPQVYPQTSQPVQHSPKQLPGRSTNEGGSSGGKRHASNQKSTQKQPKQQSNAKVVQRPGSSQHQITEKEKVSNTSSTVQASLKQQNLSQPRSRQSVVQQANAQSNQSRPTPSEEENLSSDRNSVLEFEMLEKECIQKSENKTRRKKEEEKKVGDGKEKEVQKHIETKIKDLDFEIDKFKKENKKVSLMQKECESQLLRINKEIEDFEERKEADLQEMEAWKREQVKEIENERLRLEEEMSLQRKEKEAVPGKANAQEEQQLSLIRSQQEELQRLRRYVQSLEGENKELKDKMDELTDKQVHCVGVQTEEKTASQSRKNNEILKMSEVEQIIEEEDGEDGSKQSSGKGDEENDFCRIDSEVNQTQEDQDVFGEESKCVQPASQASPRQSPPGSPEEEDEEEEEEYELKFLPEYHGPESKKVKLTEEIIGHDGKVQRVFENGKKEVVFSNGVKREVWPDGYSLVQFNNNDVKQTFPDGKIVYYFSDAKTTQTTFPNGLQVFKFSNSQIEKHFVDGTKEISFPDGTIKCLFPDGEEESIFPDGTIQKIEKTGTKIVEFPNGQKDILYGDGTKVREYEDGTIKKILPDGKTQTIPPATASSKKVQQTPVTQKKQSQLNTPGASSRVVSQSIKKK